ncbi:MAG TPA: ABC transporter permease [Pyrinomonadaceae bacterium]|nr:ABC transporter permease [Pyrinomonadaceae bacterium]
MLIFILRRLLLIVPMALLVITLTWGLIRVAPGTFYDSEKKLPPAIEANIRKKYGLDKPWYSQYFIMLGNVTCRTMAEGETANSGLQFSLEGYDIKCFDFGDSLKYAGTSVNELIRRHLPYSATIGALAYFLALLIGTTAGIIAALRQNSVFDYGSMAVAMLGLSVPNFVLGPILVLAFALGLYIVPPARWGGISSLILPVITLSAIYSAYIARLTRAGMLEVMRSDYIRTARAKGLDETTVLLKHALRGGIIPVVSFTGPALAALLAGTVVVERIFSIPGLGNIFIQAIQNRDEPLVLGIVAFLSVLVMLFNLIVDISYGFLDPRIRYE